MSDDRNPDGTFAPGNNANPNGANGHIQGWQRYGARLKTWMGKSTAELKALFEDQDAMEKLSTIDLICAMHVKDMIFGEDKHRAREAALDRMEGKPKQVIAHGGDPDNQTPISMDGVFSLKFGVDKDDANSDDAS